MKFVFYFTLLVKLFFTDANVPQLDGRIVGGENINITQNPYQVSLRNFGSHICGASIFHKNYVLTAAHCVINGNPRSFTIRAGSSYLSSGGVIVKICAIISHEKYDSDSMINDIAILKLCTPVKWTECINPVALAASSDNVAADTKAVVTGWGYTSEDGAVSEILQKVSVPIITIARCKALYPEEIVTVNMLCAGHIGLGQQDACQGDSGGPLFANGKQVGVVSWGYGCARPQFPGVYTNVAKYRNWIKNNTNY